MQLPRRHPREQWANVGVPRGLAATIARFYSCIQDKGRGKRKDVHMLGVNMCVGVPGRGRLAISDLF